VDGTKEAKKVFNAGTCSIIWIACICSSLLSICGVVMPAFSSVSTVKIV
jgi:cytochrome b subunit of formate dehydrogenase